MQYPKTPVRTVRETMHGVEVRDSYIWLEGNGPEVQAWVQAQNEFTRAYLDSVEVRTRLAEQIKELANRDIVESPVVRNGRYFFTLRRPDQQQSALVYKDGLEAEPVVLVDPNKNKKGRKSIAGYSISPDGKFALVNIAKDGSDFQTTYVIDVERRKVIRDRIPPCVMLSMQWLSDNSGFYYSIYPLEPGKDHLYFHRSGTKPSEDLGLFGKDLKQGLWTFADLSPDDNYLLIQVGHGWGKDDLYCLDRKSDEIKHLVTGKDNTFSGCVIDGKVYAQTDYKAPRSRIVRFDVENPSEEHWEEVIGQSEDVISDFRVIGDKIVVNVLSNVSNKIKVYARDGNFLQELEVPDNSTVHSINGEPNGNELIYSVYSFTNPTIINIADLSTEETKQLREVKVGIDLSNLTVEQIWCSSKDSTRIPMYVVRRDDIELNGNNPTLLYGYGGFNQNITPTFGQRRIVFVKDGGVYVSSNLRGGAEFGREWYNAGVGIRKQNVVDDLIASAEELMKIGFTNPDRLAIYGGSNGGLVVGAALTQRPELFRAVVCAVPLLDMVRYTKLERFGDAWTNELGDPNNPEEFRSLLDISPYHRVDNREYPAVLFVSGGADTRVNPTHARKMAAKLQEQNRSKYPILLRTESAAGHGDGKSREIEILEDVDVLAFLYRELGMSR